MLIILEGPDGAGKTTLADSLRATLVDHCRVEDLVEVRHSGPPTRHPLVEYELALTEYRPDRDWHIVCDRWHLGELIYPHILGRKTVYDEAMHWHIEKFLTSRGALVVYVQRDLDVLTKTLMQRGDDYVTVDVLPKIVDAYDRILATPHVLTLHTDPLRYGLERVTRSVIDVAEKIGQSCVELGRFVTYVGPPDPSLLLVGDVRGVGGRYAFGDAPAFVPYRGTSGHFLARTLLSVTSPLIDGVGLVNACDVDDPRQVWVAVGSPPVVALGRNAARRLRELDVPHREVSHPQFVRRFHHRRGTEYAEHIFHDRAPSWFHSSRGER